MKRALLLFGLLLSCLALAFVNGRNSPYYSGSIQGSVTLTTIAETTILTASASKFLDLVSMCCTNGSVTLTRVDIRDATGGTVRQSKWLAANGGGYCLALTQPWEQTALNNNWTVTLSTAVVDVRCDFRATQR